MNQQLQVIFLGIIEGLTEFIPVSSTAHLILASDWINYTAEHADTFHISIQLGAIAAVLIYYWSYFKEMLAPSQWFSHQWKCILAGCIPVLTIGFLFYSTIKTYLFNPTSVAISLLIGGLLMIIIDKVKPQATVSSMNELTVKQSFYVGLCQCVSLWPGFSRSGATIMGGLVNKLDYNTAAQFSFVIAIPVMCAAVSYEMLQSFDTLSIHAFKDIGMGLIISFVVGLLAIHTVLACLSRWKLLPFGWYRVILAVGILWGTWS